MMKGVSHSDNFAKLQVSRNHYGKLLNAELTWESDSLHDLKNKLGSRLYITEKMISRAIAKIKPDNTAKPSGVMMSKKSSSLLQTF